MTKLNFILALREQLLDLPKADVEERLRFYSEMIEDRMEEGLSEEAAVEAVGTVAQIAQQIRADYLPVEIDRVKVKKSMKWWVVLLVILGSPVWVSLLIAAVAVLLSLYVTLWAVIISLWAVFGAFIGCACYGVAAGAVFACSGNVLLGFALIGAGFICAGLSVLLFFGCKGASKGTVVLTGKAIHSLLRKKEVAE